MTSAFLEPAIWEFLLAHDLVGADFSARPLTGGVSSDIRLVTSDREALVVKMALAQLRVSQEWQAPVSRNASEVDWLIEAGRIAPDAVPEIVAHDPERGVFAMSYLAPADHPGWKKELLNVRVDCGFADLV
ncbi:hypothetical protein [Oceaniglobus trochenteri]|uniref:hypothetical protein n=1 Tax=Oceaniglobus trochenteri TaxID=2763260 RepID=UPI001D000C50|nr:hypothetical protein [Oceaniglobus trochenteri]